MSAYRDAFAVGAESPGDRIERAANILARGEGTVLFENSVALVPQGTHLKCEVIDPEPSTRRCENEYAVLVENSRWMLSASRLAALLPDMTRVWTVVEDRGDGTLTLWRAP